VFEIHIKMSESLPSSGGREVSVANPNQLLQAHLCTFTCVSHIIFLLLACFFSFCYSTDTEDLGHQCFLKEAYLQGCGMRAFVLLGQISDDVK
jgi:hypothetical protein